MMRSPRASAPAQNAASREVGGTSGKRGDEPDRDLRGRHVRAQGAAGAVRVHDVDPLAVDQVLEQAGAAADAQRIDGVVDQRNPVAARGLQLLDQRAVLARDQRAGAPLQQGVGDVERGAGHRLLTQRGHDLQDGRARERAGCRAGLAVTVAHQPKSLTSSSPS